MLTKLTEADWEAVLEVFEAVQSKRGEPGHDDRRFLEALQFFDSTVVRAHVSAAGAKGRRKIRCEAPTQLLSTITLQDTCQSGADNRQAEALQADCHAM